MTKTIRNYGVIETGTNWRIDRYVVLLYLTGSSTFWLFGSLQCLGLNTRWFTKKKGLHTNGLFTNYQCYGLLKIWRFAKNQGPAFHSGS